MTQSGPPWITHRLGKIPADLVAVIAVVFFLNGTIFIPVVRETPLRVPFILAFVLFIPGYVVVAALYPERDDPADRNSADGRDSISSARFRSGIGGIERVALSFGLSFVIVPAIAFPLVQWYSGVRLIPIVVALSAFTLIVTAVAAGSRWNVTETERFSVPYREWLAAGRSRVRSHDSRADAALTVLLVASILLAAGSVGFAVVTLPQEDEFSSLTLLVETDGGELVADGFPTEMNAEESEELVIAVDNHEHRSAEYTLIAVEQSVESDGDELVVDEQRELDRFEFQLGHDETELLEYELEPTFAGEDVRIMWLLYVDEEPDDFSIEDAPYHAYLNIHVE